MPTRRSITTPGTDKTAAVPTSQRERVATEAIAVKNIFDEGELHPSRTVAKFATVQTEGPRSVARGIEFYRLEVIVAVGNCVKSARGTQMSGLCLVPGERRGWQWLRIRFAFSELHAFDQTVRDGVDMPNLTI